MMPLVPRRSMRRAIVILPNGFTLLNLFFGISAILAASRADFSRAGWFIVLGGIADAMDGRVARATNTGSRFGEELDSLVDAISFGLAPALIMYFAVLSREGFAWVFVFLFVACAVMRLARFNVEQAGRKKTHFHGLPSPAAGMTLATYYWFSQTSLYTQTAIGNLPWHQMLPWVMVMLSFLMISSVPYPAVPTISFRSFRGILASVIIIAIVIGVIVLPRQFFFPALMGYVVWGMVVALVLGFMDRLPTGDLLMEEEEDDADAAEDREAAVAVEEIPAGRRRRRRKRPRHDRATPRINPTVHGDGE